MTISCGVYFVLCCFNLFCNVWVCVCLDFVKCGCVYVLVLLYVGILVICGCFGNMCTCIYCVLYCLYCVFVLFRLSILFVLSVLV